MQWLTFKADKIHGICLVDDKTWIFNQGETVELIRIDQPYHAETGDYYQVLVREPVGEVWTVVEAGEFEVTDN